jgi:magnesium chelatase family protein
MRISKIKSAVLSGYQTQPVIVEATKMRGSSQLLLSGLPDVYLKDSKDKIKSLVSRLVPWENLDKILAHIIPAETEKIGAHLELPLALACLVALCPSEISQNTLRDLESLYFFGALTLDGELQMTRACEILSEDLKGQCVGPQQVSNLQTLFESIQSDKLTQLAQNRTPTSLLKINTKTTTLYSNTFLQQSPLIEGLIWERFWIVSAAVTRSPVLLMGTPGIGKSTLAKWASQILPTSEDPETFAETKKIWRLSNTEFPGDGIPKLFPHPRSHISEFLGTKNRAKMILPGYFSLAHGGVLVLDEFLELNRDCREILRNILETKKFLKRSANETSEWPADFWLIATSNPCPCGYLEGQHYENCRCSQNQLKQYQNRLSGPLWDRFGLRLFLKKRKTTNPDTLLPPDICKQITELSDQDFRNKIQQARARWSETDQETRILTSERYKQNRITFRELKSAILAIHGAHLVFGIPKEKLIKLWEFNQVFEKQNLSHYSKERSA